MNTEISLFQELSLRGFIKQSSNEVALARLLNDKKVTFYLGIDPTGPSLHCGHLVPILLAKHLMQRGHQAIFLSGNGTAKIGDPSGKTEMRKLISSELIEENTMRQRKQLQAMFAQLDSSLPAPIYLGNAAWLDQLNYIQFLRDIGRHFSVNRMLSFETYKARLAKGLSFIEFNYQLLQSYDFLQLYKNYNCTLQIGGDDQWGNILSGVDLIRRYNYQERGLEATEDQQMLPEESDPQALTVPLITTSSGAKMGKTEKGAVFLDSELTSPYELFQYWRNIADADVKRFMLLYSFRPISEIEELCDAEGASLNRAKEALALEICEMAHGKEVAELALASAKASFAGGDINAMASAQLSLGELEAGIPAIDLFLRAELCPSRNEARRLFTQGGASINGQKISDPMQQLSPSTLEDGSLVLKAGKKRFFRFTVGD